MMKTLQVFLYFVLSLLTVQTSELFDLFKKCHSRDAACLTSELQKGITNYALTGLPEYHLSVFDPLRLPYVKSDHNSDSPFNVDLVFENMDIIGLSKAKALNVANLDAELLTSTIDIEFAKLLVKGGYEVKGNILIFPITGKGNAKILLENTRGKLTIKFKAVPKGDSQYGQVEELKLHLSPKRVAYRFEGLFGGNVELSDAMHEVLNANSLDIFHEIAPNIIKGVCIVLKDILNEFFAKNSYEQLFL